MNAPARVLNLLHAARREDVAPVLSLFSDAELAAGLASEHCDPKLRAIAPDREALSNALLRLRQTPEDLPTKEGAIRETVRLAARAPYQPVLPGGITPYGRPRADLRRRLAAELAAALGDDAWRWYGVMALVDKWSRPFAALLDTAAGWSGESELPTVFTRFCLPTEVFLPGVLLAMAPPAVIPEVLVYSGLQAESMIEGLFRHAPYHPAYLDYAFGPHGSDYARQTLCASTGKPLTVAHELLDRGMGTQNTTLIAFAHDDLALRLRIHQGPDAADNPWQTSHLSQTKAEQVYALLSAAETAEDLFGLLTALRPVMRHKPAAGVLRLLAYDRLAQLAGPEPVWSLELELSGGLDLLFHPAVRASMATGSSAPLVAAAASIPLPGPPRPAPNQDSLTDWPLEDAVHSHLDGRLERWRTMLRSCEEASESPLGLVQWATGQSVRPAACDIEDLAQGRNQPPPVATTTTATATPTAPA